MVVFIKIADIFRQARPEPGKPAYINVIEMKLVHPACSRINPKGRKIIDPSNCMWCFGVVGTKIMPPVSFIVAILII